MALLKKHRDTLLVLSKASPKLARKIISSADRSLITALSECALNLLNGNVKISTGRKRKLAQFKKKLRTLATKGHPVELKKKTLQSGGFLTSLLAALAPILYKGVSALIGAIKKKAKRRHR